MAISQASGNAGLNPGIYTSSTRPASPADGLVISETDTDSLKVYNGTSWIGVGGLVPVIPTSVAVGSGSATASALGQVTFTGASSVSLNGVFSSAYTNYRIMYSRDSGSATAYQMYRIRSGGTDLSSASYSMASYLVRSEGTSNVDTVSTSATNAIIGYANSGQGCASQLDIFSPFLARVTINTGLFHFEDSTAVRLVHFGAQVNNTSSYDGISIYQNTGTATGTISVYGYNK